jgi:transcriptional regulator with XRE-family HTH domain
VRDEIELRLEELGEFIRDQRRRGEMSIRSLSELSGISNPYLSQIERGLRKPSADILQQLASALKISAESLYVKAGILDEREDLPSLEDMIRSDPYLSVEQQQTLVTIYRSFRHENPSAETPEA